jgi:hypothetical protein
VNLKAASREELMNFLRTFTKLEKIEEDIRISKLRQIDKQKEELQQRLVTLNKNAEALHNNSLGKFSMLRPSYSLNKLSYEKSLAEQKQKERLAKAFIIRIRKKQLARKEKLKLILIKEQELLHKKEEQRIKQAKEEEMRLRAERLSRLLKNSELNRKRSKEEKEKRREQQRTFQFPSVYLCDKLEEKYQTKVVLPKLQEEKLVKEQRHEVYKPLSKEDFIIHQENIRKYKIKHEEEKKLELQEKKIKALKFKATLKKYNSTIRMRIKRMEEQKLVNNNKKVQERRNLRAKMLSYSNITKQKHPITISKEKIKELKLLIEQQKHPVKQKRNVKDLYVPIKLSREYRHKSTDHKVSKEVLDNSLKHNKKDYLAEARLKRKSLLTTLKVYNCNLSMDVNDKESTLEKIESRIKQIELQARLNEKVLNIKSKEDIDANEYLSDIFIHTIKAKIAILESM